MATIADWSNKTGLAGPVPAIGSYTPLVLLTITPSAADAVANTLTVSIPGLVTIVGVIAYALTTSGVDIPTKTVTWSTNSLTIAYADIVATDLIYVLAWGIPRA